MNYFMFKKTTLEQEPIFATNTALPYQENGQHSRNNHAL
jgi:hypothetical protein